jgi:hypothetical protein
MNLYLSSVRLRRADALPKRFAMQGLLLAAWVLKLLVFQAINIISIYRRSQCQLAPAPVLESRPGMPQLLKCTFLVQDHSVGYRTIFKSIDRSGVAMVGKLGGSAAS